MHTEFKFGADSVQSVEPSVDVVRVTSEGTDSRQQDKQTNNDAVQLRGTAVHTSIPKCTMYALQQVGS